VRAEELTRDVAYVFQYPEHQFVCDTVESELAFSLRRDARFTEEQIRQQVEDRLEEIGLMENRRRHPYMLSVGEKRRLSVAVMTITNPKILILDEPTYGQDRRFTNQLMDYVLDLNRRGTTVLFITHNMKLVAEFAERVLIFHQGELVFDGRPRALFTQANLVRRTQLIPPPIASVSLRLFGPEGYALSVDEFADTMQERLTNRQVGRQ
jgi:energy-coupling factor transport system ATP-binding protein